MIGRFFGNLSVANGLLLFLAPLLCWLPETVPIGKSMPWLRGLARVALVSLAVALTVVQAGRSFVKDSAPSGGGNEATVDDYSNYGG
jgi:hypothetical protein